MITKGKHTYLGTYDERFNPEVEIGNFTSIGSGLILYGTCEHPQTISTFPFADKQWCDESVYPKTFSKGPIKIGSDVWIAEDVRILSGIKIGHGAIIGAGSVVSRDVLSYEKVAGNPIKHIGFRFTPQEIEGLLALKWWESEDDAIKKLLPLMADPKRFMEGFV